jgi:hypothetical protein
MDNKDMVAKGKLGTKSVDWQFPPFSFFKRPLLSEFTTVLKKWIQDREFRQKIISYLDFFYLTLRLS